MSNAPTGQGEIVTVNGYVVKRDYPTETILAALKEANGSVTEAAKAVGCAAKTIYQRAKMEEVVQKAIATGPGPRSSADILKALEKWNGQVFLAAKELGISVTTIRYRAKQDPEIEEVILRTRGELIDLAEKGLRAAVDRGEAWAICFTLKTLGRDRGYGEERRQEHASRGGEGEGKQRLQRLLADRARRTETREDPEPVDG